MSEVSAALLDKEFGRPCPNSTPSAAALCATDVPVTHGVRSQVTDGMS